MDAVIGFFEGVFALAQGGFDTVNQILGLVIALIAAILMPAWRSLWSTALLAAAAHIVVGLVRPSLDGGAFALPDLLSVGFWMTVAALFLGYAVVIAVFFLIKTIISGRGHRRHYAH